MHDTLRQLYSVQREYTDPRGGDDIAETVAWLGNGQYIALDNVEARNIVIQTIKPFFK